MLVAALLARLCDVSDALALTHHEASGSGGGGGGGSADDDALEKADALQSARSKRASRQRILYFYLRVVLIFISHYFRCIAWLPTSVGALHFQSGQF